MNVLGYNNLEEIKDKNHSIFCDKNYTNSNDYKKFWKDLNEGLTQTSEFKRYKKMVKLFIYKHHILQSKIKIIMCMK